MMIDQTQGVQFEFLPNFNLKIGLENKSIEKGKRKRKMK